MSTVKFGDYFGERNGKEYASMTSAQLDEEIKYVEEILDYHKSLNGSADPVLRGIIEGDLKCLLAEKARRNDGNKSRPIPPKVRGSGSM